MTDCKPSKTPMETSLKLSVEDGGDDVDSTLYRQLVGSLIYLSHTRPDISYAVGVCSRFLVKPKQSHWIAAKRILRYIKGTLPYGLEYNSNSAASLVGHSDADWAGEPDTRRSTTGLAFDLGSAVISWRSKKQSNVTLSSTEAEYQAAVKAAQEAIWLRRILRELGFPQLHPTPLYCDNQSVLKLVKNPVFHARTKHIEVHHHFIWEHVSKGDISFRMVGAREGVGSR